MKGLHSTLFTLTIPTFFGLFNPAESAKVPPAANRAPARHVFSDACYQWNIQTSWSILAWCQNDEGQYGKTIISMDDALANDYGVLVAKYKGDLSYSCATCGPGTTWGMVTCLCGNGKGVDVYSSIDLDDALEVYHGILFPKMPTMPESTDYDPDIAPRGRRRNSVAPEPAHTDVPTPEGGNPKHQPRG
ncbi:hypothetical protein QBC33DRAFT_596067 [Phialemonium atrogriseum]|uniref:Cyanovirin-N domain-containing protein n=1 Tax=Phialemonium atrogriseum TaxID=1093897 RepID=A0AAJ0BTD4_9PEZI|nr:uncharacterized protein QBC33DRAFT_596067 [Phialemonium atrogriseum]KAK1764153.1 hypothetical protein QBC33DRAFT_596067 [Phialemonium atrogriseum]